MEEKAVGGKEKKYVLYTVVNDDKSKTGLGVWVVRIFLSLLLLIALAVVPYISLRLAQTNDRTVVVFQPVPIHNHSRIHHRKMTFHSPLKFPTHIQSDSLKMANYTTEIPSPQKKGNATLVMLHESAVTLSLLEDSNNISHSSNKSGETSSEPPETTVMNGAIVALNSGDENSKENVSESERDTDIPTAVNDNGSTSQPAEESSQLPVSESSSKMNEVLTPSSVQDDKNLNSGQNTSTEKAVKTKSKLLQILSPSFLVTATLTATVSNPAPNTPSTITLNSSNSGRLLSTARTDIIHKLAYVATASSGNHVGGICVWKTNKNITKWSYFYDNIPIEFQSHLDSTDHEMRALLAAVRLWQDQWHDYHVVLRSQHIAIQGSNHPTRVQLGKELEKLSDKHFTFEPEFRLRKDDSLIEIAYCLARLHKDYVYWFSRFEEHVDEMLGAQDWSKAQEERRQQIPQNLFFTDHKPQTKSQTGDLTSLSMD